MQVCLAAEKCGNLDFDVRNDMWNSSEGLYCNATLQTAITFRDILRKVHTSSTDACFALGPRLPADFSSTFYARLQRPLASQLGGGRFPHALLVLLAMQCFGDGKHVNHSFVYVFAGWDVRRSFVYVFAGWGASCWFRLLARSCMLSISGLQASLLCARLHHLTSLFTVNTYLCATVHVHSCPCALLSMCNIVHVRYCPCALLSMCATVHVRYCPCALLSTCTTVLVHYCPCAPLSAPCALLCQGSLEGPCAAVIVCAISKLCMDGWCCGHDVLV